MVRRIGVVALLMVASAAVSAQSAAQPEGSGSAAGAAAAAASESESSKPVDWEGWRAHNSVTDVASLQRGARNFMNYCIGCHSLKYMRYQRMADDLKIPAPVLQANLLQPGANSLDYITTPMPPKDAQAWFGKVPPDLSLITRSKGDDHVYRIFKTYYQDPARPTGTDNLEYPLIAMPDILSGLRGVQVAKYREAKDADGKATKVFDHFEIVSPGNMTPEEYDGFVRDTVNFLDYVGEPVQVERRSTGIWVVLFLLALSALAYLLKREYWKDVH
jgi:ubiquinol-cytochrome c reductase cytochrome c1 subunit